MSELLEREAPLAQLHEALGRAAGGHGVCALVHGEAGIGKTTLLRHFVSRLGATATTLCAGCEALFAPRPYGPLADLADQLPPSVGASLRDGRAYSGLFPALLDHLQKLRGPVVLALEDVHWADEGTLDFVRYAARRIAPLPVLLLLTYRDDELAIGHPLRDVLGHLPAADTVRIGLSALSNAAVESLARQSGRTSKGLHGLTGGNPFFVTEILQGTAEDALPASVCDAVLARLSRVGADARALAQWVSAAPGQLERDILAQVAANAGASIDECLAAGLLQTRARGAVAFRHELARQAVHRSLLPSRRIELHRSLFGVLDTRPDRDATLARRLHHAEHGELAASVTELAPLAACEAQRASAHREAAACWMLALEFGRDADATRRAGWLEELAGELRLLGRIDEAMRATHEALAMRRTIGDRVGEAANLAMLAAASWREFGDRRAAEASINESLEALRPLEPGREHVRAWCTRASLQTSWSDHVGGLASARHALALAQSLDDPRVLLEALHVAASARLALGDDKPAMRQLERALDMAVEQGLDDDAGRLFVSVQTWSMNHRDYETSLRVAARGIAYCEARDLDVHLLRMVDRRATALADLGRWDEADRDLAYCMASPAMSTRMRSSAAFLQARLGVRRGRANADAYWLEAQRAPQDLRVEYRLPAIAAACAEAAWLRGDTEAGLRMAMLGVEAALRSHDARLAGPAAVWARRCGAAPVAIALAFAPAHARELAGDIDGAAREWQRMSCPYERGLALLHGDEARIREGLRVLVDLGAEPAARIGRERLRALGVRGAPRGPQPRTRGDPLGLTPRERQVYRLLLEGMSNAAIAARLHRSPRTVEHHVANVLAKLDVGSRVELLSQHAGTSLARAA
jgi:DNA-binding CsgD family transcriptional regulator/tetratricopeptide (TPR) repeat protein